MENEIEKLTQLLRTQGMNISVYEDSFLEKSIEKRLSVTGSQSISGYCDYLRANKGEAGLFLDSLRIAFSEFFRNQLTFAYLEQIILPALIERKKKEKENEIRIWSAACAAGQEAYSMAIIFDEIMENAKANITCRIFATDANPAELTAVQKGIYQMSSLGKVTLKRIKTYFTQKGENFTIAPELREYIDVSNFDLLDSQGVCPPVSIYGNFDIVLCSNLLFYYKPEYQKQIIEKIGHCLATGGYLVTGETERDIVAKHQYREIFAASAIFQKTGNK